MSSEPIVIVTGANRGIGYEICRELLERRATVVLTARNAAEGEKAVERLQDTAAPGAKFHVLDVNDDASATALHDALQKEFGAIDVLINNAGIVPPHDDNILSVPTSSVEGAFATNTVGPLRVTQALLPLLRRSSRGARVIVVSSGAGELNDLDSGWSPAYSLSKAAVNLLTRMLAPELRKENIVVNAMCPGWVRTDMGGAEAPRDVSQGADTAVWLALDAPAELTGKFLRDRKPIPW
jgi:NAD(P)-dependent dehydrogenase (short-subunit alcohol dehydrogenase family)